jgi:hypothetical protein
MAEEDHIKRARIEEKDWATSPQFFHTMLTTKVDRFFTPGEVIFTASRENKIIDVWKVRKTNSPRAYTHSGNG